ncbi:hypothetical protein ACGFZL_21835 [Streptomyces sp. NPDC048182]|uniref:hypothetical protein n=1 Tax=unclassified Streptomyces TaxID=2593676 RepID=UPI0033AFA64E
MAKNKNNRDRKQPRAERAPQGGAETNTAVLDREEPPSTPTDPISRKRQKRFGHN